MRDFRVMDTAGDRPVVVVGSGAAGLAAALSLAPLPVCLVTAGRLEADSSSAWAQGGIAAALGPGDSPQLHARDTVAAGAGLVDEQVAGEITEAAPECIEWLARLGVPFDRETDGGYSLGLEGAHSRRRITRVGGDGVGRAVVDALAAAVRRSEHIEVFERHRVIDLLGEQGGDEHSGGAGGHGGADGRLSGAGDHRAVAAGRLGSGDHRGAGDHPRAGNRRICGVLALDPAGRRRPIAARAVVLATGGVGSLYGATTNPPGALGHGIALALRAGAAVRDAEFVQFHPTAIDVGRTPMPLATEALRGEGAVLVDESGAPILDGEGGELAPRDVVARAIARRLAGGRADNGCANGVAANVRRVTVGAGRARYDSADSGHGGEHAGVPRRDGDSERAGRRCATATNGAGPRRRCADSRVYLDATRAVGAAMPERFPAVTAACRAAGIDPVTEPIPVRPAAHYHMGGIAVDSYGRSGVAGLYACGEVACTGLHGANRLASNSLLEAIVCAQRVAKAIAGEAEGIGDDEEAGGNGAGGGGRPDIADLRSPAGATTNDAMTRNRATNGVAAAALSDDARPASAGRNDSLSLESIRELTESFLGVEREEDGLRQAIVALAPLAFGGERQNAGTERARWESSAHAPSTSVPASPAHREFATTATAPAALVSLAIAVAADRRRESRGGHYRSDYRQADPAQARSRVLTLADLREAVADVLGEHDADLPTAAGLADIDCSDEPSFLTPVAGARG